ncbi:GAF and ANTAR domain-containing protein [Kineococcus sp. SYSU DK004]|uniref:GAF and ANTAR domain-containing protein n=1 Tax=Kineococcus sp. SYSU DK004 TaxID=3383125 RepID=UPI003D7CE16C
MQAGLGAAVAEAGGGLAAADRLCVACVDLLEVDGAAISLVHRGSTRGTFGSSGPLSRRLDALQFVYGEGPCLDAVAQRQPVLVGDLAAEEDRWPAFTGAVLEAGVRAVFALPVVLASDHVGALDMFRHEAGPLDAGALHGALLAAHLAALPVLDLVGELADRSATGIEEHAQVDPWNELDGLERVEIYQATGVLIAQLGVGPTEALVRLRARAFTTAQTASEVAWELLDGRLAARPDGSWDAQGAPGTGPGGTS